MKATGNNFFWLPDIVYNKNIPITHLHCHFINRIRSWGQTTYMLAVNTRTVLAIVPPQGCEAILVEILQSKRSAGGPHFTCCFLKSK